MIIDEVYIAEKSMTAASARITVYLRKDLNLNAISTIKPATAIFTKRLMRYSDAVNDRAYSYVSFIDRKPKFLLNAM